MRKLIAPLSAALAAFAVAAAPSVQAQEWPSKPVRLVVPYPPGGNVDGAARIISGELQKLLGQPIVVENKAGAGGMLAGEHVARADPDGYTLFMAANGPLLYSPTIYGRPLYHWQKDFAPISTVSLTPLLVQVHPSVPAKTVPELVALAKAKPDSVTMASPGAGTTNHLLSEMLQKQTGAKWVTAHYKGNAPATNDLLGGQVQFNIDQVSVAQPFIKDGRTRPLAVIAPKRVPWLPDVPTLQEQGITGVEGQTFTGVLAPAGTPPAVIDKLSTALRTVLANPDVKARFYQAGADTQFMTPKEFSAYLAKEESTWLPIIRAANIKAN
ncbi:Bug family tripartite tricarboxylate transporter substrate binding protein [Ramlibacter rhizophilus]|uniref:Tripartite tricarboxylate transporter substrate binding protein n=1 Tax=Ramlibacter rhizophilus TaxID=1781167 RepID=A0A4Z0BM56_9BURK|nr:tripartite tricarboxylate transporter substrate binding protein [Ramlibacter rhizophilus]TFY99890.1 tripartite tricarboxylate transporter substrate binding protein [Ramlibacter rhizophilus]